MSSVPTVSQIPGSVLDTVTENNLANSSGSVPTTSVWQTPVTAPTSIVMPTTSTSTTIVVPGTGSSDGIPTYVGALAASESPYKNKNGQMFTAVSISFVPPVDINWAGVQIWFSGYNNNPYPQLMATGNVSPLSFLVETTGETVLVTANSVSPSGFQPLFSAAPTTTVTINGVLSAPSPPSIANSLVTTPTGYQFQFNYISGLSADVIMSYNIYKNSSNSYPGPSAGFVKSVNQPSNLTADPSATGVYTYQETVPLGTVDYYWVTSVNQIGLESSPVFAGTANAITPIYGNGNLQLKNIAEVVGSTTGPTSASATYATIPEMSISVLTKGNPVFVVFTGILLLQGAYITPPFPYGTVAIFRDGSLISPEYKFGGLGLAGYSPNFYGSYTCVAIDVVSAGPHTYTAQWKITNAGVGDYMTSLEIQRNMQAVELG